MAKVIHSNFSSDHFLFCSEVITPFLSQLFTCMIRHSCIPSALRNCILQPLLTLGKDPCKSDSYRPIALAPTLNKAFDRVDHHALFQKLLWRSLPPVVAWLLLFWYQKQSLQVRWQSILSHPFGVSNGVRQDGVLLPILFTICISLVWAVFGIS